MKKKEEDKRKCTNDLILLKELKVLNSNIIVNLVFLQLYYLHLNEKKTMTYSIQSFNHETLCNHKINLSSRIPHSMILRR